MMKRKKDLEQRDRKPQQQGLWWPMRFKLVPVRGLKEETGQVIRVRPEEEEDEDQDGQSPEEDST